MRVLVIQHDHSSPIGPVGERFADRGYDVVTHAVVAEEHFTSPGVTTDFPDFTSFDAVVPMGAPWSTYDVATVGTWVLPELEQLRAADAAGVPVLGICFGGQLLAEAHGGTVQFHPELTSAMLAGWLANGGDLKARELGLDPDALLALTIAVDDRSRERAHALVDGFLAQVADDLVRPARSS